MKTQRVWLWTDIQSGQDRRSDHQVWVFGGKEVKPLGLLGEPSKNRSWKSKRGLGWQASSGLGAGIPPGVGDGMTPADKSLKSGLCDKGTAGQD